MIVEVIPEIEDFFDEVDAASGVRAGVLTRDVTFEDHLVLERAAVLTCPKGKDHVVAHLYGMKRETTTRYAKEKAKATSGGVEEWSNRKADEMLEEIEERGGFEGKRGYYNPSSVSDNIWRD